LGHWIGRAGLLLVALIVLATSVPAVASAVEFHSEVESTGLTGEGGVSQKFTTTHDGFQVSCSKVTWEGTLASKTAPAIELLPAFSECTYGIFPATIKMNGCKFRVTTTTVKEHFAVDIVCPAGAKAEISSPGTSCPTKFGGQLARVGVAILNKGSGNTKDLSLTFTIAGIAYERPACLFFGEDLHFGGTSTVKGYVDLKPGHGGPAGIWIL
jgi:hypothetical protein